VSADVPERLAAYRRARLSALAGGGAFGSAAERDTRVAFDAASSLASAARSGSRRGAWGYRPPNLLIEFTIVNSRFHPARAIFGRCWRS
jgi:hypothetical protein